MPQTPPSTPDAQLRWLLDRAQIGDLLTSYALSADARDWASIAELFVTDGVVESPLGSFPAREYPRYAENLMAPFAATHHTITNHAVTIDGDRARSRAYLQAIHVTDTADPSQHADIGGWYDHEWVRVDGRWMVEKMVLSFVWTDGAPLTPSATDAEGRA
ncbi:hypothetical protein MPRI_35760 [Mycobacterium paraintracellulare]|uniref:SnoaL-like domain-containing protein n=1 Tax=Mycobacterium paraintracellulare TaxID=1138383 RepID=A0ABM7KBC6_9MYCO|nr:hypothetical protein OCQ_17100 [Mycobacterium paraintracellulare]OSC19130.1 hypothetical protein B8W68_25680 [Mycobacterium paraintracellulare]BBY71389.1 hypothetical protein MPRI_35760 [Mycobacterium paraintracellulare]